ncbi:MAG: histidinol dehydrogenase, partial [Gammaproteobacteria bacterium]|nr:histidinol dehydrogenase [Gammaproteobacteria bacterium]
MTVFKASPIRLSTAAADFEAQFSARLHWSSEEDAAIEQVVGDILADVRRRGDEAVLEYTRRFDRLAASDIASLELSPAELRAAFDSLPAQQREA